MGVFASIKDALTGVSSRVTPSGALLVVNEEQPPKVAFDRKFVISEFFKTSGGVQDMRVDGSVTPVEFFIEADPDDDIYIREIQILIVDAGSTLAKFGNLGRLTNGLEFFYEQSSGVINVGSPMQSNYDMGRFAGESEPVILSNVIGNEEGFSPTLDVEKKFGLQFGIKLRSGTKQRAVFKVNDNLSVGINTFEILASGFRRLPDAEAA